MSYGHREVLRGIDLEVSPGEVFAFLGPNGAGKTTTLEILEGFKQRSAGVVTVLGSDPAHPTSQWRARVGAVLQSSAPERDLTVRETIDLYAGFYSKPLEIDEILAMTGLHEQASVRNRRLSGGQQRRLDMALALVGDPDLLFLDEPTTGFDPAARRAAWQVIDRLRAQGKTIFLTTHYLEEAELLADRIAVIVNGRIVAHGTPADLGGRGKWPTTIRFRLPLGNSPILPTRLTAASRHQRDGLVQIDSDDPTIDLAELTGWAIAAAITLEDLDVSRPSLEQIYLELTGEGALS
jgi:ABC-2 type transport system ATP-binding protein